MQCEGSCEEHKGEVVPVLCYAPGDRGEPWKFNYCEEAIAEDERRGFTVIKANPTGQPPPRFGAGSVAPGCSNSEVQK